MSVLLCHGQITIFKSYSGYKAICPCSPKLWGLGDTEAEARASLCFDMEESKNGNA
jgi:hypothetical protein